MTEQRRGTEPMRPSEETSPEQLPLAREQGAVMLKALEHMITQEAHGEKQYAGDYLIAYAVESAEGLYAPRDGGLEWQEPQEENAHIEVAVCDSRNGRFIPGLVVHVTVLDRQGRSLGTHEQHFLWHPWLYHYGRNWKLPGDGEYTLRVRVEAPTFHRHDKVNGNRFAYPVEVEFPGVWIRTGRK